MRFALRLSTVLRLVAAIWALGSVSPAAAAPLSAAEREAVIRTLAEAGVPAIGRSDEALLADLRRHAGIELGQRLRPRAIVDEWAIQPVRRDVDRELEAARETGRLDAWLSALSPTSAQYRALRAARSRYVALAGQGWSTLPAGLKLKIGDRADGVIRLRERLAAEGYDAGAGSDPTLFDAGVQAALEEFQSRHGLEVDGVLGPATRAALDVPATARLAQIDANLERHRWTPRDLPGDRLEVDTGGATATLFAGGRPTLSMRVIVGDPKHPTPMFASRIEAVVFNPPWRVPGSIATKEILPRVRRDPGYLARNNFTWVGGQLVQRPGPKNSLGVVKFDLPSPFGVYLHDTPGKAAFSRADRALSHGCMRLEKPRELAAILLAPQGGSADSVDESIAVGATRRVELKTTVPLYVFHWTAFAEDNGRVSFRRDVYGWDRMLAAALAAHTTAASARGGGASDCAEG
jgi:murein L,D-transpeptidase YcbB/YkuD